MIKGQFIQFALIVNNEKWLILYLMLDLSACYEGVTERCGPCV